MAAGTSGGDMTNSSSPMAVRYDMVSLTFLREADRFLLVISKTRGRSNLGLLEDSALRSSET